MTFIGGTSPKTCFIIDAVINNFTYQFKNLYFYSSLFLAFYLECCVEKSIKTRNFDENFNETN